MTDTEKPGGWEPWMDNPLMLDQEQGFTYEEPARYHMQVKQPYGGWEPFTTPRENRDEVTRIQAFHLDKDPDDHNLRVWKRVVVWTLDEVPGRGEGQTPPEEILARNEEATKRLIEAEENTQQPSE
jgi:hypothetical protein